MLLANRSGQDIEYRLGGGGAMTATKLVLLREGAELPLKLKYPCTLEVLVDGKVVVKKTLTEPHDLVEILQAKSKYTAKATVTAKPPTKSEPKVKVKVKTTRSTPPEGAELR